MTVVRITAELDLEGEPEYEDEDGEVNESAVASAAESGLSMVGFMVLGSVEVTEA